MKIVGVIPARWGSTRLPGKSLVPLCGKPLVQWVWERARQARRLDDVVVATDDLRIRTALEPKGCRVVMTRSDHPSGTDRVAEAVAAVPADIVVNIQGDEPLIDPALIDRLAGVMAEDPSWDMATAACPITHPGDLEASSVVKVVWARNGAALYFSRSLIPFVRNPEQFPEGVRRWRHIGLYAYRRTFLDTLVKTPPCLLERAESLEQLRALDLGGRIRVVETTEAGLGVDTPEDVPRAEAALRAAGLAGREGG